MICVDICTNLRVAPVEPNPRKLVVVLTTHHIRHMESMRTEYARYRRNTSTLQLVRNTLEARKVFAAIMERWTMLRDNDRTDEAKTFFLEQVEAKKMVIVGSYAPADLLAKVEEVFSASLRTEPVTVNVKRNRKVMDFKVGNCQFSLSADRVGAMRDAALKHDKETDPDIHIAACMLRYKANFGNHRQFSMNSDVYSDSYAEGYTVEGMSSAFNSQLMLVASTGAIEFCSLYPDVEGVFGSLGSFFSTDFTDKKCILNPPRITDIVKKTVDYCVEQLSTRPCSFRIFVYDHDDAVYIDEKAAQFIKHQDRIAVHSEDPYTGNAIKTHSMTCYTTDLSSQ